MTSVLLSCAAVFLALLWFLHLERSGQKLATVGTILVVLVIDAALYPGFKVPAGLFHPQLGSTSFRPYEVLIVIALIARLATSGIPHRMATPALLWVAFFGWWLVQAFVGLYVGHPAGVVTFEAKVVVYLGAMALAAGIPVEDLVRSRTMNRIITFAAVVAFTLIVLDGTGYRRAWSLPGVPLEEFGRMGSDFASVSLALGVLALGLSLAGTQGRTGLLIASSVLILPTFVPSQRAVLISFVALLVLGPMAVLSRPAWRRLRVTSAELAIIAMAIVAVMCVPWIVRASQGAAPSVFVTDRVTTAFVSPGKLQSAQDRVLQYQAAWPLIKDQPVFGWGLGKTLTHFQPGPNIYVSNNLTHNILADLLLRAGVVGLGLFCAAAGLSLRAGFRTWRNHPSDEVAYLALACAVVIVGLLGKGTVESIFEKFRLAVLLGLFLGMLRTLAAAPNRAATVAQRDRLVMR